MDTSASSLPSGTTIGSYRVDRVIAESEQTTVYEAAHVVLPRRAALKLLRADAVDQPTAVQRLAREACALEAFAHPGVARVFDCGVGADGRSWLAMELVGGEPLTEMLARIGPLSVPAILDLTAGIVDVVAAAHRSGLVHRALAARHIMVASTGPHGVRVLGWGHSHQPGHGADMIGDRRTDMRAVGAIAYEAATGRVAFPSPAPETLETPTPIRMLRPDLGAELAALIEALLEAAPMTRPDAAAVVEQLARWSTEGYAETVRTRDEAAAAASKATVSTAPTVAPAPDHAPAPDSAW